MLTCKLIDCIFCDNMEQVRDRLRKTLPGYRKNPECSEKHITVATSRIIHCLHSPVPELITSHPKDFAHNTHIKVTSGSNYASHLSTDPKNWCLRQKGSKVTSRGDVHYRAVMNYMSLYVFIHSATRVSYLLILDFSLYYAMPSSALMRQCWLILLSNSTSPKTWVRDSAKAIFICLG